ncbi:MAG: hypothetical protein M1838_000963 [Thelocarpon superellum]|nr:MAG: hypothetical protein M1838_000963 [Thelocarpon superellum]
MGFTPSPSSCVKLGGIDIPDISGIGVLASYVFGTALVFFHVGFDAFYEASFTASSLILFDTAGFLALSWQIAALFQLSRGIGLTYNALMICFTAFLSIAITLGALGSAWEHMRRRQYRLTLLLFSVLLSIAVTAFTGKAMLATTYPLDQCVPFFVDHLGAMKSSYIGICVLFWITVSILSYTFLFLHTTMKSSGGMTRLGRSVRTTLPYLLLLLHVVQLILYVLVHHHFVPEQQLDQEVHGLLASQDWQFGQLVSVLIWLPVVVEFVIVFMLRARRGLEGRLPNTYKAVPKEKNDPEAQDLNNAHLLRPYPQRDLHSPHHKF